MNAYRWIAVLTVWVAMATGVWAAEAEFKSGDAIQVEKRGRWIAGKVLEKKGNQYLIRYDGLDSAFDELVPAAQVRTPIAQFKAGDSVDAQKGTKWIRAKVLDVKPGEVQVHYDGLDAAFDEWIAVAKMRAAVAGDAPADPQVPAPVAAKPAVPAKTPAEAPVGVGSDVDVRWGGKWVPGKVIEKPTTGWLQVELRVNGMTINPTLPPDDIKPRGQGKASEAARGRPGVAKPPVAGPVTPPGGFEAGAAVEINRAGKWIPAKVIERVSDKMYRVKIDGSGLEATVRADTVQAFGATEAKDSNRHSNTEADPDADVTLTEPKRQAAARIQLGAQGMPWTYKAAPALVGPAAQITPRKFVLKGGTGGFFEQCTLVDVTKGARPLALVSYKDEPPGATAACEVEVVDALNGATVCRWVPLQDTAAVAISPDGKLVLCRSDRFHMGTKGRLDLWAIDGAAARLLMSWRPADGRAEHDNDIETVFFVDATHALTHSVGGTLTMWELPAAKAVWEFEGDRFQSVSFSQDKRLLLVSTGPLADAGVGLFDTVSGKCLGMLPRELNGQMAFSPDGRRLATCVNSAFTVWDLETRTQVLEVGGASWMSDPRWINDRLVLAGNQSIVDSKLGIVVLRISGLDAMHARSGGVIQDGETAWNLKEERNFKKDKKEFILQCGALPVAEAMQATARIRPEEAYLLTPGTKVTIDFSQATIDNTIRDRAIANLTAQLKTMGVIVADNQNLRLAASKTQGENKSITYHNMQGGGEVTVGYTIQKYALQLTLDGTTLWQTGTQSGFAPGMLSLRPGENAQDQVNKMNQNADGFFEKVRIPRLVARPQGLVQGGGTPVFR